MKRYDKLKSIIEDIDVLLSKNVTNSSPEFTRWKTRIERFLISEYGKDSYEMNVYKQWHFSPGVYYHRMTKSDFVEACKSGLEQAKAVLSVYLDEISEKCSTKDEINPFDKLKYEYSGIRNVVAEYTTTGFVLSYLDGLEQGINRRDKKMIMYFLAELVDWYKNNWTAISNNVFVNNLEEHEKNIKLLKDLLERIVDCEFHEYNDSEEHLNSSPIIFLSHRASDKKYGDALKNLLSGIGIKNNQLIYTSHPLHKIPLDKNIYDYLRECFDRRIFVIVLWSNEYLESPACLNEIGAMWVIKSDYTNLYVPTFDFNNPKYSLCAVDTNKMGVILDGSASCKLGIVELKDKLVDMFHLKIDEKNWTYTLDQFIKEISD